MEQSKFEKEIQEKMQAREIMPSDSAWDRLDAMLAMTEAKPNPKKKRVAWLGIAASVVFVLGLGYSVHLHFNEGVLPADVVEVNLNSGSKHEVMKENVKGNETFIAVKEPLSKNQKESDVAKTSITSPKGTKQKVVKSDVALKEIEKEIKIANETVESPKNDIQKPESDNVAKAQSQLVVVEKQKLKVDAKTLLNQVDGEMELTFREKVFKSIKKNYKETKEAIASRNEESSINH